MAAYRAPGRVNLIGDHTDYNDGFVLPMAIQLETVVRKTPRSPRALLIASNTAPDPVLVDLCAPLRPRHDWTDYVVGVASVLLEEGRSIEGAELSISSTVPAGAGLSSSAALEVATALALLDGACPDRMTVARWCQRAENTFVGARCGIMDQYVACFGRAGHALMIDCRSLKSRTVPLPAETSVIVSNTMVRHRNAAGEYNLRRQQCEDAVRTMSSVMPGIDALRDVTMLDLTAQRDRLPWQVFRRARHVVSENARVIAAADALEQQDVRRLGELMSASHGSLRDDFAVSTPELDLLVDLANGQPGVFGSRMTGAGFGGSIVTLAASTAATAVVAAIREGYARQTGTTPDVWVCSPSDGASEIPSDCIDRPLRI
jgi:galactokinase